MLCGLMAGACSSDEERLTENEVDDVITESLVDAYFEDTDDMAWVAVTSDDSPSKGGRLTSDDRFCASLDFSGNNQSGEIVLDFGNGCTDPRGNTRSGVIRLQYSGGPANYEGFTVQLTFEDYKVNGVLLSGTRTLRRLRSTDAGVIRHEITLEDGRAEWPDGSVSTRSSEFTREIHLLGQAVFLYGHAEGQNRRGRAYAMQINETLVYKRQCVLSDGIYMAVDGVKTFTSGGKSMTIDYGSGECDRTVTVTVGNGAVTNVAIGN